MQDNKQDNVIRVTLLANAILLIIGAVARVSDTNLGSIVLMLVFFAWLGVTMWYASALRLATLAIDE